MQTVAKWEVRRRLVASQLMRLRQWEILYSREGASRDEALAEFTRAWEQMEYADAWAAKYAPQYDVWKILFCELTQAAAPFWRRLATGEKERRRWLHLAVELARQINRPDLESSHLEDFGNTDYDFSNYGDAIRHYQEALAVKRPSPDLYAQSRQLTNLGNAQRDSADRKQETGQRLLDEAEHVYEQSLGIAQQIGDRELEERNLSNWGILKVRQERTTEAIDYFQKALTIAEMLHDDAARRRNLGNLASQLPNVGDFKRAIEYANESLRLAKQLRDKRGESQALANLGLIHRKRGDLDTAVKYFDESYQVANKVGLYLIAARQWDNLAEIQFVRHQLEEALQKSDDAFEVAQDRRASREIGFHGFTLGWILIGTGNFGRAVDVLNQVIAQEGGQATNQGMAALGVAQLRMGNFEAAKQTFEKAIHQAEEVLKKSPGQYKAWQVIGLAKAGLVLMGIGDAGEAVAAFDEACKITREQGTVSRQLVLLQHLDPQNDTRLDVVRQILQKYLADST